MFFFTIVLLCSSWHVSIYACAFFFLCSKVRKKNGDHVKEPKTRAAAAASYQLADTQEHNSKDEEDTQQQQQNGKAGPNKLGQP